MAVIVSSAFRKSLTSGYFLSSPPVCAFDNAIHPLNHGFYGQTFFSAFGRVALLGEGGGGQLAHPEHIAKRSLAYETSCLLEGPFSEKKSKSLLSRSKVGFYNFAKVGKI